MRPRQKDGDTVGDLDQVANAQDSADAQRSPAESKPQQRQMTSRQSSDTESPPKTASALTPMSLDNVREIMQGYPVDSTKSRKAKYLHHQLHELGIQPRQAGCCCCVILLILVVGAALVCASAIYLTSQLNVGGSSPVLRAANGDAVATAQAKIKADLAVLRKIAQDPGSTANQKYLRDLTYISFGISSSDGDVDYVTMQIAEAHTRVKPTRRLILISPAGSQVIVYASSSANPEYCTSLNSLQYAASCTAIDLGRRLSKWGVTEGMAGYADSDVDVDEDDAEKEKEEARNYMYMLIGFFVVSLLIIVVCFACFGPECAICGCVILGCCLPHASLGKL